MMISLQSILKKVPGEEMEHRFFAHSVQYLSTTSGRQMRAESWMITSLDVEFGHEIGSGG
jgi:hypothetical protein